MDGLTETADRQAAGPSQRTDTMLTQERYADFAYPAHMAAPHFFEVTVRDGYAFLTESFGAGGGGIICRARLPEDTFRRVREEIRQAMNARIRGINEKQKPGSTKIPTCKGWSKSGPTRTDRILGRELTVLFWALEGCPPEKEEGVIGIWRDYRPEELWWLFMEADKDGRDFLSEPKGWRLALPVIFQKG